MFSASRTEKFFGGLYKKFFLPCEPKHEQNFNLRWKEPIQFYFWGRGRTQCAFFHRPARHLLQNDLTSQFGFVKFDENPIDEDTRLSEYIRLALQTDKDDVVRFMRNGWNLNVPDLIITVTGGAKKLKMSARLRKTFQQGLVSAAVTTNAWIITAGTNAGVVKEVGEALNNYRYKNRKQGLNVPCIGICSWGYTAGKEQLDITLQHNGSSVKHPVDKVLMVYDIGDNYGVKSYLCKNKEKGICDIEPNHTHFLLFDDGTANADNVLNLRADIETQSRHIEIGNEKTKDIHPSSEDFGIVPIVMVLVEGGPSSIKTVCKALESGTPLVVIKESGRAADLVADLHAILTDNNTLDGERPKTSAGKGINKNDEMNQILAKATVDIKGIEEVKDDLCRILREKRMLVTIFKFDSKKHNGNLEDAILEALFNAAKFSGNNDEQHQRVAEFKLTMAWQKFIYAKQNILTDTTISKWKEEDLHNVLMDALRRGHVNFVELLCEFGASLERITVKNLDQLYALVTNKSLDSLPLKGINSKKKLKNGQGEKITKESYYLRYLKNLTIPKVDQEQQLGQNAPRDLFLWAVFSNRFELAKYLCSKTWNQSIAPLVGAKIYRVAAKTTLDSQEQTTYEDYAKQFDTYSKALIDKCFDNDENFAVDIVKRKAVALFNYDPRRLAKDAGCRSFLASRCVQRYLDNKWYGNINYKRRWITFRIFLVALFLPLLPFFSVFLPYVQKHKKILKDPKQRPNTVRTVTK
ncbi:unnamed protein product [Didymodactylos carnosus]|nr:unnamed protein product [Didymodactylos carnosus]CAF3580245.1 unnamed protein product [Didymodactylos carnosus]